MMSKLKYIAEGFHEDAGNLLNDFLDRDTTEFSKFASIWRKHHFSLIFMGRPDHTETTEFINEVFRITTQFLSSPSFYQQIGAVYLLYALFRNQISTPTVKIRIEINQWRIIKSLRIEAMLKKYRSLHYVIDYLIKHAFIYVAHQTLKGPLIGSMQKISKNHETVTNLKTNYKSDIIQYSISNNLMVLRDLHAQYLEERKNISSCVNFKSDASSEFYENFISDLHEIVHPKKMIKEPESLGSRRAKIKAQSFIRKTKDRFGRLVEDEDDSESDPDTSYGTVPKIKRHTRARRVPKHERRVGRPSKKPKKEPPPEPKSDDDIDISHLLPQQQQFYLPPVESECRKNRSRRDPYYKVSPKREEDDSSDADNPM